MKIWYLIYWNPMSELFHVKATTGENDGASWRGLYVVTALPTADTTNVNVGLSWNNFKKWAHRKDAQEVVDWLNAERKTLKVIHT